MKILGIDYGRSKIGLAIGETETGLVEPLGIIRSKYQVLSIKKVTAKEKAEKIVVGVPGGKMEEEIRRFGEKLREQTGLPMEFFDETLTSQEAQKLLIEIKRRRKFRQEMEDAFAAAIMLESYLGGLKNV